MLSTRQALVQAVRDNPDDKEQRLILADWCEDNGEVVLAEELRQGLIPFMLRKGDDDYRPGELGTKFRNSIIAQDDDNDYQESGYVVVRIGDWCAIARYSHCSCYGTWAAITGGCISDSEGPNHPAWDWQGTYAELLDMAKRKADPSLPEREASPEDYDYDHLCAVYSQILSQAEQT